MRFAALLLVAALAAVVSAQVPTVTQSLASFDQNGGVLTVYGTGFIQRNLDQFTYKLVTGAGSPCAAGCQFFCHYHTMVVNPAGTITYCEVPYIPDRTLGVAGSNYITLSISNANGATINAVTVAVINAVPTSITPSTVNLIPPVTTGITLSGIGFPSENAIFQQNAGIASYQITLTDSITTVQFLLNQFRSTFGLTTQPMKFWNVNAPAAGEQICRYTKTQIDCYYLTQLNPWQLNNNVNGLFATLTIQQQFAGANYPALNPLLWTDTVGPIQIGIIVQNLAPSITPVPIAAAPYLPASFLTATDPYLTISATNLLQYPVVNSNIFVPSLNGGGNQDLRCDTVSANVGTFVCALTVRPAGYQAVALVLPPPASTIIAGKLYAGALVGNANVAQPVAITNTAGALGFKYPINAATLLPDPAQTPIPAGITPSNQAIQQDALTLTFHSASGSFYPPDVPYLYEYGLSAGAATAPKNVAPSITITGLLAGNVPMTCTAIYPDQVEPNTNTLKPFLLAQTVGTPTMGQPQSVPASDVCNIIAITNSAVTVKIAGVITAPVGTVVSATLTGTTTDSAGNVAALTANPVQPIGIVAPGAGVGGDPHFFGFLGEKYEFAGEAGRVYNLLTDDEIQLNAEIGYWHWNRGQETIIRKLALKTNDHRVLIDAGGNHLGTEGFSLSVDGAAIAPSRTRQTYLGTEGWIRWYPLSPDDKFRLPLWDRHKGVALVEILLNDYKFQVLAVEEGKDKDGVWHKQPSRFLDFMAEMLTDRRPHGLFGQSAHLRANQRSAADFAIEGQGTDYEVSNLFGDDFSFNKFGAAKK